MLAFIYTCRKFQLNWTPAKFFSPTFSPNHCSIQLIFFGTALYMVGVMASQLDLRTVHDAIGHSWLWSATRSCPLITRSYITESKYVQLIIDSTNCGNRFSFWRAPGHIRLYILLYATLHFGVSIILECNFYFSLLTYILITIIMARW